MAVVGRCPRCGRLGVMLYETKHGPKCGKCLGVGK